jgi:hypothetical protein
MLLAGLALLAGARPGGSQSTAELPARMESFVEAVRDGDRRQVAGFFPATGTWSWVQRFPDQPGRWGVREFSAMHTLAAISDGGPVCDSFQGPTPEGWPVHPTLAAAAADPRSWRRATAMRFVPRGQPATSPVFVQWRRENGRWVVSSIGDYGTYLRQRPQPDMGPIIPDATPPRHPERLEREPWFVDNEPLEFMGSRYIKYGLPRDIRLEEVVQIGRAGNVPVYRERGAAGPPEVLYIPVATGGMQAYQAEGSRSCGPAH